jgi:predicted O-methyltransferase YrrM
MQFLQFQQKFSELPGFIMPESLCIWDFFLEFQSRNWQPASLLEIGVYHGKSAMMLALHCKPEETVLLVDPSEYVEEARKILTNFKAAKFEIIKTPSSDAKVWALSSRYTRSLRWIHIDGDHKAATVWNDLSLANQLLSATGIVCVDDFFSPRYPQLTYVLFQFLEQHRAELQLFFCGFCKGYLARPAALPMYLRAVREDLASAMKAGQISDTTIFKTDYPYIVNAFGIDERFKDFEYHGLDEDPKCLPY